VYLFKRCLKSGFKTKYATKFVDLCFPRTHPPYFTFIPAVVLNFASFRGHKTRSECNRTVQISTDQITACCDCKVRRRLDTLLGGGKIRMKVALYCCWRPFWIIIVSNFCSG